jgi:sec-independent protein translocase protein TatA
MSTPMIAMPGGWELVLIVFVLILLFGAKKLPDLARGTGRALRIFKSETRGLMDDDDDRPDERSDHRSDTSADDRPRPLPSGGVPPTTNEQAEQPHPTHRPYDS